MKQILWNNIHPPEELNSDNDLLTPRASVTFNCATSGTEPSSPLSTATAAAAAKRRGQAQNRGKAISGMAPELQQAHRQLQQLHSCNSCIAA